MRRITIALILLAGCSHLSQFHPVDGQAQSLTERHVRNARRIVITQSSSALWTGQSTRWVFDADGKCFGECVSFHNGTKTGEKLIALPPATCQEVQSILLKSRYFSLKDGFWSFQFEGGGGLRVECADRQHSISFGQVPPEARQLWDYLDSLASRATE